MRSIRLSLPSTNWLPSTDDLSAQLVQAIGRLLLAVGLVVTAGLAGERGAAAAQPTASTEMESTEVGTPPAQWLANFDLQVARQLQQSPAEVQADLLEVLIREASQREDLALPQTASALLRVVETSEDRANRMMAVQALSEIRPGQVGEARYERAMSQLYALGQQEGTSDRVRGAIADAIISYRTS